MITIFSVLISIVNFIKKRSKVLFILTFIFLWILMSFTYGNADESIYMSRYNNPYQWQTNTEYLYMLIIFVLRKIGFSYQGFKVLMSFIELFLISVVLIRKSKFPNFVLILYFLFPFMIDVAQMRNALATSLFIFGSQYLLDYIENRNDNIFFSKNEFKYFLFVLIATFIHTASIFWLLLWIAARFSKRIVIIFTIIFFLTFTIVFTPVNMAWVVSKFGAAGRMDAYLSTAYEQTKELYLNSALIRVLSFAILMFILIFIIIHIFKNNSNKLEMDFLYKVNFINLCIIPIMLNYTTEIYRMQIGTSILAYIIISNSLLFKNRVNSEISLYNVTIELLLLIFTMVNAYMLILRGLNYNFVFVPVFKNNILLSSLF